MHRSLKLEDLLHLIRRIPAGLCVIAVPVSPEGLLCPSTLPPLLRALVDEGRQYGAFFLMLPQAPEPPSEGR